MKSSNIDIDISFERQVIRMWECEYCGCYFHPDDVVHDENGNGEYCSWQCAQNAMYGEQLGDMEDEDDLYDDDDLETDTILEYIDGTEENINFEEFTSKLESKISDIENRLSEDGISIDIQASEKVKLRAFRDEDTSITLRCTLGKGSKKKLEKIENSLEYNFDEDYEHITFDIDID